MSRLTSYNCEMKSKFSDVDRYMIVYNTDLNFIFN